MNEIEILEIRLIQGANPLKGLATIKVGDWITYDWRIVKRDGERILIQVPQTMWRNQNGQSRYKSLLSIPKDLQQRIEVAILSALEKEIYHEKQNSK